VSSTLHPSPRVAVIGAGIGGLAAARALAKAGTTVDVYEQESAPGGLAARVSLDDISLDRYYHFVCGGDNELSSLCRELSIPITWQPSRTSFFYNDRLYPFGRASHLLKFAPLKFTERLRQGLMMLASCRKRDWHTLDDISAEDWLIAQLGEQAYNVIWYPLLRVKFGEHYRDISAAWIWHRIHRLLTSRRHPLAPELLGYMHGGAGELIVRLAADLRNSGSNIYTDTPVRRLARQADNSIAVTTDTATKSYPAVVCALPAPLAADLLGDATTPVLRQVKYIGVVCMLLVLDRHLTDSFWINTNDPRIAFNGFIEFSNLNPAVAKGRHVIYIPYYCQTSDPRYTMPDKSLFAEYIVSLRHIQPALNLSNVRQWCVYRSPYAQPICACGFSQRLPPLRGPWPNLYIVESSQLYPGDRNLSSAIALSNQVAASITTDLHGAK
jgi:protoporphyrinogen oxidase